MIWSSRTGFGAPGLDLELRDWLWSSRTGFGALGLALELQGSTNENHRKNTKKQSFQQLLGGGGGQPIVAESFVFFCLFGFSYGFHGFVEPWSSKASPRAPRPAPELQSQSWNFLRIPLISLRIPLISLRIRSISLR